MEFFRYLIFGFSGGGSNVMNGSDRLGFGVMVCIKRKELSRWGWVLWF